MSSADKEFFPTSALDGKSEWIHISLTLGLLKVATGYLVAGGGNLPCKLEPHSPPRRTAGSEMLERQR